MQGGKFKDEVVALEVKDAEGNASMHTTWTKASASRTLSLDGIKGVKLLREGGAITAATSSQICDGASGVMVVNEKGLKALGVKPLARIHHLTVIGGDPVIMLGSAAAGNEARA